MEWHKEIRADLPASDRDEPALLRESIEDELRDHLECAMERERSHCESDSEARAEVLNQFGDVGEVARRLWLDAMAQRLLTRRVLLGLTVLLAVCCVGLGWMGWRKHSQAFSAFAALQDAKRTNADLAAQVATLLSELRDSGQSSGRSPIRDPAVMTPLPRRFDGALQNGDFEQVAAGRAQPWGAAADKNAFEGDYCGRLEGKRTERSQANGGMTAGSMQVVAAQSFRGTTVRFRAAVRIESNDGSEAFLWLRVDGNGRTLAIENMANRPITSKEWRHYEVELPVPESGEQIACGLYMRGEGVAWLDDASLTRAEITNGARRERKKRPIQNRPLAQNRSDLPKQIRNGTMEKVEAGRVLSWRGVADDQNPHGGAHSLRLDVGPQQRQLPVMQAIDAKPFRGKRIRYRTAVRVSDADQVSAQLWCRIDLSADATRKIGGFDNMKDRPIKSEEWKSYDIVMEVDDNAELIALGFIVKGNGSVWFDDATLEVVDKTNSLTSASPAAAGSTPFWNGWLWLAAFAVTLFLVSQRNRGAEMESNSGHVTKFAIRFTFAYWLLYCFPRPFDTAIRWIPGVGRLLAWYRQGVDVLVRWTASHVMGIERTLGGPNGSGDTTFSYIQLLIVFTSALAVALLWTAIAWRQRTSHPRVNASLRLILRYTLAFALLGYGLAKVGRVGLQFPTPGDWQLSKTYGESSPMNLVWTFMGVSIPYTNFAGLSECGAGLLLLWRRTTPLGAMAAFAVMLNVVMLNFCYDVPVKIYSTHLLCMALIVVWPDLQRMLKALLDRSAEQSESSSSLNSLSLNSSASIAWRLWGRRVAKAFVLFMAVGLPVGWKIQTERAHSRSLASMPEFFGDFSVVEEDSEIWTGVRIRAEPDYRRRGRQRMTLRLESPRGMATHEFQLESQGSDQWRLLLANRNPGQGHIDVQSVDDKTFLLAAADTSIFQGTELRIRREIDRHLLTSRGFHWINETPFNR